MADGFAKVGEFSNQTRRSMATRLAREGLELTCLPVPIPSIPLSLVQWRPEDIREWRKTYHEREIVEQWTAWEVAKAGAIAENESRLRGLLWCYRALRSEYESDKADTELAFLGKKVRAFISKHWGIDDPPLNRIECNTMAMQIVATRVPQ